MRTWPSDEGIPLGPELVTLPVSHLPDLPHNKTNHHLCFPAKRFYMGGVIYKTLRDLESLQEDMQKDVHNIGKATLHALYGPPVPPTPIQAVDYILNAYDRGERLQFGCLRERTFKPMDDELIDAILMESFRDAWRSIE